MPKLVIVDSLAELDKLEKQSAKVKFKLFIPRAIIQTKRPAHIWSTKDSTNMYVVMGTSDLVAIAKMVPGEHVPAGVATATYLRV
jgi:hypothetical protein